MTRLEDQLRLGFSYVFNRVVARKSCKASNVYVEIYKSY